MAKKKPVNNLVVVADQHCGCQLGLCSPEGMRLDEGGRAMPSELQLKVWAWWDEFWNEWVPMVTKGEPYILVENGDLIDGVHHEATTQMSHNLEDQAELAYRIMRPQVDRAAAYYQTRGTEAHEQKSAVEAERLAKRLGAIPNKQGQYARYSLRIRVGNGLVQVAHTIGTASSTGYESSAVQKELEQAFVEAAKGGSEPPNVIIRSHRHRQIETRIPCYKGYAISCVTAGWQLKTPYAWRVAGARQAEPQFGGMIVRSGDNDVYTRHWVRLLEPEDAEVVYGG